MRSDYYEYVIGIGIDVEEPPQHDEKNQVKDRPERYKAKDIHLTRGFKKNVDLYAWITDVKNGKAVKKCGSVILIGNNGTEVCRFNFFDAWPKSWSAPIMRKDGLGNSVLYEELVISVKDVEFAISKPDTDVTRRELEKFEGAWEIADFNSNGIEDQSMRKAAVVIRGNQFEVTLADGSSRHGSLSIDPNRNIKSIDITYNDGPLQGKTFHGIYRFDGDKLIDCYSGPGQERPSKFESRPGQGKTVTVHKRPAPTASKNQRR
jgi:phage tail-like protein